MTTSIPGYLEIKDAYLNRLRRIEGQVRGLQRRIEQDTYCIDVLTQISATTRVLEAVALRLLDEHDRPARALLNRNQMNGKGTTK